MTVNPSNTVRPTADASKADDAHKKNTKPQKKTQAEIDDAEMSDEDRKLKVELELYIFRVMDIGTSDDTVVLSSLTSIADALRTATDSVTSVPKALKLLAPHFNTLALHYDQMPDSHNKRYLADILSVLAIIATSKAEVKPTTQADVDMSADVEHTADTDTDSKIKPVIAADIRELSCLKYRLNGGETDLISWGHEYIKSLSGEIAKEYNVIKTRNAVRVDTDDQQQMDEIVITQLRDLCGKIIPFNMHRNAEYDAIDLAAELDELPKITENVMSNSYRRVVTYLCSMSQYTASIEEYTTTLTTAYDIMLRWKDFSNAFRLAVKLNDASKIDNVVKSCSDRLMLKQLAFMSVRQRLLYPWIDVTNDLTIGEELNNIANGEWLSTHYLALAEELDVLEPKSPQDVYKVHLEERRVETVAVDSAKQNLASTFVNAFVNAGYGKDKLMTALNDTNWLYKNKDHGMTSAAASLGLIHLWDISQGLSEVDKLQWSTDINVKAGAFMAFGMFNTSVKNEWDPAFSLLADHLDSTTNQEKIGAIMGLAFAYTSCRRSDILELLIPIAIDMSNTVEVSSIAALALGLVFVGSCNEEIAEALVQTLIERSMVESEVNENKTSNDDPNKEESTDTALSHLTCVGLGLIFLGRRNMCEATLAAIEVVAPPMREYAMITVEGMAFAGSGEVLMVQKMLRTCAEIRIDSTDESKQRNGIPPVTSANAKESPTSLPPVSTNDTNLTSYSMDQVVAVLNLPLITMGDETGSEMMVRIFDHLLQYAAMPMRRAVPLALALHSLSNPQPQVLDTLAKLSHDADSQVALRAILALGIVGAGTNNSRIATLLRQLASYYGKDVNGLFCIRIAQGFLHMGKGLVTLSPIHSDRFLIDPAACGCIIAFLHICLNLKTLILGEHHYFLYLLTPMIFPRMLVTVDQDLKPLPVIVRVGQVVDVVGQAGSPKTITGFQTHTTPVLLAAGERAELACEEYESLSSVLEGVVILRGVKPPTEKQM